MGNVEEIADAIRGLDKNKPCGMDGSYGEHLMYCSNRILPLLAICFTSFFVHGFLPDNMLSVILVPIIKDKSSGIGNKHNYRPIAIASIMSKVIEKVILQRLLHELKTIYNQFGFKLKLGTDMSFNNHLFFDDYTH